MSDNKKSQTVINGFVFENAAEAIQAGREAEGVKYIREKTDMDNPQMVLQIYNKMIQQRLFETAVGFSFLKDLQEYLQTVPSICKEDILPIPVQHPMLAASLKRNGQKTRERTPGKKEAKGKNADYRMRYRAMRALCIVLAICVMAMFAITATSGNATILNYETELINKYEAWEQELNEREAALLEREAALDADNRQTGRTIEDGQD